jgi:hypothetical protein
MLKITTNIKIGIATKKRAAVPSDFFRFPDFAAGPVLV